MINTRFNLWLRRINSQSIFLSKLEGKTIEHRRKENLFNAHLNQSSIQSKRSLQVLKFESTSKKTADQISWGKTLKLLIWVNIWASSNSLSTQTIALSIQLFKILIEVIWEIHSQLWVITYARVCDQVILARFQF